MSTSPSRRMKIGDFLLRRLEEVGIGHLFGVPGDYNLVLMRLIEQRGMHAGSGPATSSTAHTLPMATPGLTG
jgi:hypothetical protein